MAFWISYIVENNEASDLNEGWVLHLARRSAPGAGLLQSERGRRFRIQDKRGHVGSGFHTQVHQWLIFAHSQTAGAHVA